MNTSHSQLMTALAAFTGGFMAGLLVAPETRRQLSRTARGSSQWVGERLHALDAQLRSIEQDIQAAGAQFGDRVRTMTRHAVAAYVPALPEDEVEWDVERGDLAQDLRHLPRR